MVNMDKQYHFHKPELNIYPGGREARLHMVSFSFESMSGRHTLHAFED